MAPFSVDNLNGTMSLTGWLELTQYAVVNGTNYAYESTSSGVLSLANNAGLFCSRTGFYLGAGSVQMAANNSFAGIAASTFYLNGTISLVDDNTNLILSCPANILPTTSFTLQIGFDGGSPYNNSYLAWDPLESNLTFTLNGELVMYNVDDNLPLLDADYYVLQEESGGDGQVSGSWSSVSCPTIPNAQWEQETTQTSAYVYVNKYTSNVPIRAVASAPASDPAPLAGSATAPAVSLPWARVQREALDSYFAWLAWANEHKKDSGALLAL